MPKLERVFRTEAEVADFTPVKTVTELADEAIQQAMMREREWDQDKDWLRKHPEDAWFLKIPAPLSLEEYDRGIEMLADDPIYRELRRRQSDPDLRKQDSIDTAIAHRIWQAVRPDEANAKLIDIIRGR